MPEGFLKQLYINTGKSHSSVCTVYIHTVCISYNTPLSALAGIRARCPRARSAQGQSARIPPEHDNRLNVHTYIDGHIENRHVN